MKKPKSREVWQLWPSSARLIRRPSESVRIEWSHEHQAWAVQFTNLCVLLHSEGQLELPVAEGRDFYTVDSPLGLGSFRIRKKE